MPIRLSTIALLICVTATFVALAGTARAGTWPATSSRAGAHYSPEDHSPLWFQDNGFLIPRDDFPVQMVLVGEPPEGLTLAEVEQAARHVAEEWSSVPCSSARLEYAGVRESAEQLRAGEYPFVFADPDQSSCLPDDVIAWTRHQSCGEFPAESIYLNTRRFRWVAEPRPFQPAVIDPSSEALEVDLDSVLTHEYGHVLGLAHSLDPLATMYATYKPDGRQAALAVDDKLGMCALYEASGASDECRSGRDCGLTETCEPVDGLWMCHEFRGELGDACALDRLVCTDACVLPSAGERYGYCTAECGPGAGPCPQNFECVEGLVREGERHCERLTGPEEPSCASGGPAEGSPVSVWLVLGVAGWRLARRKP